MNITTTTANGYENWITTTHGRNFTKSKRLMTEDQFREWVESKLPKAPPVKSNSIIRQAEREIAELLKEAETIEQPIKLSNHSTVQLFRGRKYTFVELFNSVQIWRWEDINDSEHFGYDVFDSKLKKYPKDTDLISFGTLDRAKASIEFEQVPGQIPTKFTGTGEYIGQTFKMVEEYKDHFIYKCFTSPWAKVPQFDVFPKSVTYPTPEEFGFTAFSFPTIELCRAWVEQDLEPVYSKGLTIPTKFVGDGEYLGQRFEMVDQYNDHLIYRYFTNDFSTVPYYDVFHKNLKRYPSPEEFGTSAFVFSSIELCRAYVNTLR